jgi:hypothetical protein
MAEQATGFSTPHLFVDAITQMAGLFRTEVRLLRAELSEKASKAVNAIGLLCGSAVLLLAALIVLLQGAVAWLVIAGLPPHLAGFLVGAVVAIAALALFGIAVSSLKVSNLRPDRVAGQVDKDITVAKEAVR